jgi:hypothetical protein
MTQHLTIYYPRGCGGSWLSNLIWHLENNNLTLPKVQRIFDHEPFSKTIEISHKFNIYDESNKKTFHTLIGKSLLFSTNCFFNMYINDAYKVRYGILNLDLLPLREQLFTLSDSMRYIFTDQDWHDHYCNNIDLDYRLIFQDPAKFSYMLFDILHRHDIKFCPDRDYVHESIKNYKSTCCDPDNIFGNLDSLIWLGCCHALTMLKDIPLPVISENIIQQEIKELLEPFNEITKEYISTKMFQWL